MQQAINVIVEERARDEFLTLWWAGAHVGMRVAV